MWYQRMPRSVLKKIFASRSSLEIIFFLDGHQKMQLRNGVTLCTFL